MKKQKTARPCEHCGATLAQCQNAGLDSSLPEYFEHPSGAYCCKICCYSFSHGPAPVHPEDLAAIR